MISLQFVEGYDQFVEKPAVNLNQVPVLILCL